MLEEDALAGRELDLAQRQEGAVCLGCATEPTVCPSHPFEDSVAPGSAEKNLVVLTSSSVPRCGVTLMATEYFWPGLFAGPRMCVRNQPL